MADIGKQADNASESRSSRARESQATWSALSLAWQLGYTIAIPIVALALGGRLLDRHFGTTPWLLVTGIFLSLILTTFLVYVKTVKLLAGMAPPREPDGPGKGHSHNDSNEA